MTGLLSLPPELIRALGDELRAERKILRTTCKYINESLAPIVLSSLVINLPRRAASTLALLDLLAGGTQEADCWRYCVRRLTVIAFNPTRTRPWRGNESPGLDHCLSRLKCNLQPAITSLVGLRHVIWNVGQSNEPGWLHDTFVAGLAALPLLQDLEVNIPYGRRTRDMGLDRISTLTTLKLTLNPCLPHHPYSIDHFTDNGSLELQAVPPIIACNPNLRRLVVLIIENYPGIPDFTISLDNLLSERLQLAASSRPLHHLVLAGVAPIISQPNLRQLRHLKSVSIECGLRYAGDFDNLWLLLREEQIFLEEIVTDRMSSSLTKYLEDYEGLERLELLATAHRLPPAPQEDVATLFFHNALPKHFKTLRRLVLMPMHGRRWCVTSRTIRSLCQCGELRYLGLLVDAVTDPELHIDAMINTFSIGIKNLMTLQIDAIWDHPSKDLHVSSFSTLMLSMHAKGNMLYHILKYRSEPYVRRLPDIRQGGRFFYGVSCVEECRGENRLRYIEATGACDA